jgi:hypothetical protein
MTLARDKHTPGERWIAKQLGLSDAQLDALLRIRQGYWPGNAAAVLEAKGYAFREEKTVTTPLGGERTVYTGHSGLTAAGEELLRRARAMGF